MPYGDYFCRLLAHSLCVKFTDFLYASPFLHFSVEVSPWTALRIPQLSCHSCIQLTVSPDGLNTTVTGAVNGFCVYFSPLCSLHLGSADISHHLDWAVVHSLCQYDIKNPDYFTCDCHHGLHLLQRILFACPVILMDLFELRIWLFRGGLSHLPDFESHIYR